MVSTSAGMRCRECAYVSSYLASAAVKRNSHIGMAAFAGFSTGIAGAYVTALLTLAYPLLALLVAPVYGRIVADSVNSFCEDIQNSTKLGIGLGGIIVGSLIAFSLPIGALKITQNTLPATSQAIIGLAVGLAIVICYSRLKQQPSK